MGEVYRAHDEHLDGDVVIKILSLMPPSGRTPDPQARHALAQEARALSRLNHPDIATIYDFARDGDIDYIVMEYIPGESLATRIAREANPARAVAKYCQPNAGRSRSRVFARDHHRDLKPANLQITPEGRVKILDFGLARLVRQDDVAASTASTDENVMGITGTLAYMAPEQLRGERVDARTDLIAGRELNPLRARQGRDTPHIRKRW